MARNPPQAVSSDTFAALSSLKAARWNSSKLLLEACNAKSVKALNLAKFIIDWATPLGSNSVARSYTGGFSWGSMFRWLPHMNKGGEQKALQ